MNCLAHNAEAVGVCAYCGRALCTKCLENAVTAASARKCKAEPADSTAVERLACSASCAAALADQNSGFRQLLDQSLKNAQASAFYCYLCAGLSAAGSVVAYFMLPSPFLILFTAGCAVVLTLSGFWYGRILRKKVR